jgi:hypothetical protein
LTFTTTAIEMSEAAVDCRSARNAPQYRGVLNRSRERAGAVPRESAEVEVKDRRALIDEHWGAGIPDDIARGSPRIAAADPPPRSAEQRVFG